MAFTNRRLRVMVAVIILGTLAPACTTHPQTPAAKLSGATPTSSLTQAPPAVTPRQTCTPTIDDGVSPSYQPDAPVRSSVGHGHTLSGLVLASGDCRPIANAKLEFWPEEAGKGHPDEARATLYTDQNGRYQFECDPPEHIHMRITAAGYRTIGVNSYHPDGQATGVFDIVLAPEPR